MIDYLKGSIVKIKLNFEKVSENKRESTWWWQISSKTVVCLEWGNLTIVNNLYFQSIILLHILINFVLFPKMIMDIFLPILIKGIVGI